MGTKKIVTVTTQQRAYVARAVREEREEQQLQEEIPDSSPEPKGPTNSEIAAKLGISKRQVAKMRRENTLQQALEKIEES